MESHVAEVIRNRLTEYDTRPGVPALLANQMIMASIVKQMTDTPRRPYGHEEND
ncbi:hypothetical protein SAMN04488126_11814 [Bhargavaea beijingensis]|uniref:Uncharacterized protein n=1 Tax=Bhargavaea beijingensis TaxID=426756 RepID=A0A1G7FD34_9BACL|nr:hypothetical protein SAMN04488126_11814 [Bhargavaea beijingensis]